MASTRARRWFKRGIGHLDALVYVQAALGDLAEAIRVISEAITLVTDDEWRKVAQQQIREWQAQLAKRT